MYKTIEANANIVAIPTTGKSCSLYQELLKPLWVKFIYYEKATKFSKIFTLLLTVFTVAKSKVKISQKFVAL